MAPKKAPRLQRPNREHCDTEAQCVLAMGLHARAKSVKRKLPRRTKEADAKRKRDEREASQRRRDEEKWRRSWRLRRRSA